MEALFGTPALGVSSPSVQRSGDECVRKHSPDGPSPARSKTDQRLEAGRVGETALHWAALLGEDRSVAFYSTRPLEGIIGTIRHLSAPQWSFISPTNLAD
jgi:hypothetical protein